MKKLDDDKVTYFDIDSITFMCECGSEITLMANLMDICPICNRQYILKANVAVYEYEDDDEIEGLLDEDRSDDAD